MADSTVDPTKKLLGTTDAMVWAEEFSRLFVVRSHGDGLGHGDLLKEQTVGLMVGWFANAIETAKSEERKRMTSQPMVPDCNSKVEQIAAEFHAEYEQRAKFHDYETRSESAVPWYHVPRANRDLMMSVVGALIARGVIRVGDAVEQAQRQRRGLKIRSAPATDGTEGRDGS